MYNFDDNCTILLEGRTCESFRELMSRHSPDLHFILYCSHYDKYVTPWEYLQDNGFSDIKSTIKALAFVNKITDLRTEDQV